MMFSSFLQGFGSGLALIVAIGAQNVLVLRQGLVKRHVTDLVVLCALSDALLILAGVLGLGALVGQYPSALIVIQVGGALFLSFYGALALRRVFSAKTLAPEQVSDSCVDFSDKNALNQTAREPIRGSKVTGNAGEQAGGDQSRWALIVTCLMLTFLNPHVYLDTVLLLGGLSARFVGWAKVAFAGGAMLASLVWFAMLGYGARLAVPAFQRPAAWRVLDTLIAIIMFALAVMLIMGDFAGSITK